LFEHLVALIQDEVFDILQVQFLALDESQDTPGGSDDNMRAVRFQDLLVFGDGKASEKDANLKGRISYNSLNKVEKNLIMFYKN
jgi:hypothetical protein